MNEYTAKYLEAQAMRIFFLIQNEELFTEVRPLFNKSVLSVIRMVRLIGMYGDVGISFDHLAKVIGQNPATTSQKLSALSRGGFPIILSESRAWEDPANPIKRPR